MNLYDLNLARRPFVNSRPVTRVVVLLWVLGALLMLDNLVRYWGYFSTSDEKVAELVATEERIDSLSREADRLGSELAGLDLTSQNAHVRFLNRKIAGRTFSWSRLFDDLGQVLPNNVRLTSLAPLNLGGEGPNRRARREIGWPGESFELEIDGIAKTGEDQLEFIDNLFADPAFEEPRLKQDSELRTGGLRFSLSVRYRPAVTFESRLETVADKPIESTPEAEEAEAAMAANGEEPASSEAPAVVRTLPVRDEVPGSAPPSTPPTSAPNSEPVAQESTPARAVPDLASRATEAEQEAQREQEQRLAAERDAERSGTTGETVQTPAGGGAPAPGTVRTPVSVPATRAGSPQDPVTGIQEQRSAANRTPTPRQSSASGTGGAP